MENLVMAGIALGFGIWIIFLTISRKKSNNWLLKELESELKNLNDFTHSQVFISKDLNSAIAIDSTREKISLVSIEYAIASSVLIPFKDVLSCEIIENKSSLTKTVRSSQVGGALVGGVLLGAAGAIIGGLSGKTHTVDKVKNIDLLIVINNMESPIFRVNFLTTSEYDNPNGYDKDSDDYKSSLDSAKKWQSLIAIIIKKVDEEDKKSENQNKSSSDNANLSISDEIRKLKLLKDDGLINADEYSLQKEKLLNK
jgi:hypothetical protein